MKVALYDKGGGRFIKAAAAAARGILGETNVITFDPDENRDVVCLGEYSHVVCHLKSDREQPSWPLLIEGDLSRVKVILRVSSQGAGGMTDSAAAPYRLTSLGTWIFHLLEPSGANCVEWERIFSALLKWDSEDNALSDELTAIFQPRPEWVLALRLLCEAWECVNVKGGDPLHDIEVHAPGSPSEWLDPFAEIKGEPGPTSEEVAAQLGDRKGLAIELFASIENGDRQKIATAVHRFLNMAVDQSSEY